MKQQYPFSLRQVFLLWPSLLSYTVVRYLYVRWGTELSKMVVFVGESGDTDYEGLLGGLHKSVVLKGVCNGAVNQLHANRNYPLSDVVPVDSANIAQASEEATSSDIRASLETIGLLK